MTVASSTTEIPSARGSRKTVVFEIFLVLLPIVFFKLLGELEVIETSIFRNLMGQAGVVTSVILATILLRRRGMGWAEMGLRRPSSKVSVAVWSLVAIVAVIILPSMGLAYIGQFMDLPPMDYSRFEALRGNFPLVMFWMVMAWTTVAFGEEMLQRGFLLNRFADFFGAKGGPGIFAFGLAAIVQAAIFGLSHIYQGWTGVIATGLVGLVMGVVYLTGKRSLWPLIIAHGVVDTLGLMQLYYGGGSM